MWLPELDISFPISHFPFTASCLFRRLQMRNEIWKMPLLIYCFTGAAVGVGVGVAAGLAKTIGAAEITPFPS